MGELEKVKIENFGTLGMREVKRLLAQKSDLLRTLTATQDSARNEAQRGEINQGSIEIDTLRSLYGEKDIVLKNLFKD